MARKHDLEYQKIYKGKIGKINFFPPFIFVPTCSPQKRGTQIQLISVPRKGEKMVFDWSFQTQTWFFYP